MTFGKSKLPRARCARSEGRYARENSSGQHRSDCFGGDWRAPLVQGNAIVTDAGAHHPCRRRGVAADRRLRCRDRCRWRGRHSWPDRQPRHITFGDYTPRQKTVGFLESYVHGGVTTSITASEVHVPGRPKDPAGVKALAVAAKKSFDTFRPGGMRVHAGAVILEPGLTRQSISTDCRCRRLARQGRLWRISRRLTVTSDMIGWAKEAGMVTPVHTGGSSIPGSSGIWADHLLAMQPDVSFHTNGGPVAMPDADFPRLVDEIDHGAANLHGGQSAHGAAAGRSGRPGRMLSTAC